MMISDDARPCDSPLCIALDSLQNLDMEVPAPESPNAYSEMLNLYPNIPENVVKMYVQEYSSDLEKCSQMLNMMHLMQSDIQTLPVAGNSISTNQEPENIPLTNPYDLCDNVTETTSPKHDLCLNGHADTDFINQNCLENDADHLKTEQCAANRKPLTEMIVNSSNLDSPINLNQSVNFSVPLELHISIDEESDSLHSWRPNMSNNLCPDFFLPSLMTEDFQTSGHQAPSALNLNLEQNVPQVERNTDILHEEHWNYDLSRHMFHGYFPSSENPFEINFQSHLHFQKCQMNAIKYEVIKTKIELGEIKESVEKLSHELKMKSKSENFQDIEQLNDEIIQLRLECQTLCSQVDFYTKDKGLLGETDESFYCNQKETAEDKSENLEESSDQHSTGDLKKESTEELQLWQCPKCTFDNHPAMSVCEMCRQGKRGARKPIHLRTPPHSPKKGSLSILS